MRTPFPYPGLTSRTISLDTDADILASSDYFTWRCQAHDSALKVHSFIDKCDCLQDGSGQAPTSHPSHPAGPEGAGVPARYPAG